MSEFCTYCHLGRRIRWGATRAGLVLLAVCASLSGPAAAVEASELQFRAGTPSDRDGDGIDNTVDGDDDNDLVADVDELPGDADGDGVPNVFDTDADNDGIADLVEAIDDPALLAALDADGDGLLDAGVRFGANGMADLAESAPDTGSFTTGRIDGDGDGVPVPFDLDSDNDGLADVVEAGGTDADGDAHVDRFRDFDVDGRDDQLALFPIVPRDSDGDGRFDFRDTDSDGDGFSDRRESAGVDTDGDGVVDGFLDGDGDGLDDRVAAAPVTPIDSGGDNRPDHLDAALTPTSPGGVGSPGGSANGGAGRPVTGRAGNALAGCSVVDRESSGPSSILDPTLIALAALSLCALGAGARRRRRRTAVCVTVTALALGGCGSFERPHDGFGIDGYHAGAGVGASRLDADVDGTSFVIDERGSTSAQLTLGATLAPWLDAEVRAADLGSMTFADGSSIDYRVADVGAVLRQRHAALSWFGRAGVGALFNGGDVEVDRRNAVHLLLGAGADVAIGDDWRLRIEASGHDIDAVHADIGVVYRFGHASTGPIASVRAEPVPEHGSAAEPVPSTASPGIPPSTRGGLLIEPIPAVVAETVADTVSETAPRSPSTSPLAETADATSTADDGSATGSAPASPLSSADVAPSPGDGLRIDPLPEPAPAPPARTADAAPSTDAVPLVEPSPQGPSPEPLAVTVPPAGAPAPASGGLLVEPLPEPIADAVDPAAPVTGGPPTESASPPTPAPSAQGIGTDTGDVSRPALPGTDDAAANALIVDDPATIVAGSDAAGTDDGASPAEGVTGDSRFNAPPRPFDAAGYDIRFERDSDRLTAAALREIESLAFALEASPETTLSIVMRAGFGGDPQADLLSRRRALAVVRALGEAGVDVARLRPEVRSSPDEPDPENEGAVRLIERRAEGE